VYVTHDQIEAMTMGHRIAVMSRGVLQQIGPPQDVYSQPANLFVAQFIGSPPMNTVSGRITRVGDALVVELPGGRAPLSAGLAAAVERRGLTDVVIGVRPESLRFVPAGGVAASVSVIESLGYERHVVCRLEDSSLAIVRVDARDAVPRIAEAVHLGADVDTTHVFDPATGERVDAEFL